MSPSRALVGAALAIAQLSVVAASFNPCQPVEPIKKGGAFVVGLAFWPGGTEADWGDPVNGAQPCDQAVQQRLSAAGVRFATYSSRVDKLSVMRTSFKEQLALAGAAPGDAPAVVSVVAFRGHVRSDARYVLSADGNLTGGTGFAATLSLMSKFEHGILKYLQFYNLTCSDCGGWGSDLCLNGTACTVPLSNCTCNGTAAPPESARLPPSVVAPLVEERQQMAEAEQATKVTAAAAAAAAAAATAATHPPGAASPDASAVPGPKPAAAVAVKPQAAAGRKGGLPSSSAAAQEQPEPADDEGARRLLEAEASQARSQAPALPAAQGSCNLTELSACATNVNLAYDGLDATGAAFSTAAQVRKLRSYSLKELFHQGKDFLADFKEKYYNTTVTAFRGKISEMKQGVAAPYTGQDTSGRATGSATGL